MYSRVVIFLILLKKLSAIFTGFHLGDYPAADFSKTVKLSSQSNSFVEVKHFFGKIPFHVQVYAIANDGNNKGFKFDGTGVCQSDVKDNNAYGGVIFAYDNTTVRVWVPTRTSSSKVGSVIFVGGSWGGNRFYQDSVDAEVTIEAWKDGPAPSFEVITEVDAGLEKNTNIIDHDLNQLPEIISVRVFSGVNPENSYIFHATGVTQTSSNREYGGVVFAYNEKKVVLWPPNKSKTGCTLLNKRWGNGKYYTEMYSKTCTVHIRLWVNSFPPPIFQTTWKSIDVRSLSTQFLEIKHNLKMYPSYVKLQYRSVNKPYSLVFEGVGSVQSTVSNLRHGGLVFAYDKVSVRIWLPSSNNSHQSKQLLFAIFVGDGWGNSDENITEILAEFRIQIFLNRCLESEKVVDSQGSCRDVNEIVINQDMSTWSKCSNPCGKGFKQRNVTGCRGQSLQTMLDCKFENDFCNFLTTSWKRSRGQNKMSNENKHLKIPLQGLKKDGFFVYSTEGVLTSPELKDATGCILLFKYSTGKYFGSIQIDILNTFDVWKTDVWSMNDAESFNPNVWLTGYLNIGYISHDIKRFRFVHEKQKNTINDPVSVTDIVLKCRKPDEFKMTAEACKEKEETLPSCFIDVLNPFLKGSAWSVSIPFNDIKKDLGPYVTSNGMYNDLIAIYKVQVIKAGLYNLWIETFAMSNSTNSVIVKINEDVTVADTPFNKRTGMWLPINKVFHLQAGSYMIMLLQKEKYFSFKNMMLNPKDIVVWSELGMQSRHIPDSNIHSTSSADSYLAYSRLNGRASWMTIDTSIELIYLEIQLPDIALINKIATQGGTWLDTARPNFYCYIKRYKIKYSLDGHNFAFYRNLTTKETVVVEGNNNLSNLVVEHIFDFVLVAKSIRVYPSNTTRDQFICLRTELYGYYKTNGTCPIIISKPRQEVCQGSGECENINSRCQIDPSNNQSVCLCNEGFHGNSCQFVGCSSNPCLNGGVCNENGKSIICICLPGFHGIYCQAVCPKGKYGVNCGSSCNCPENEYCNPVNGSCLCEPGFHGNDCNEKCLKNSFGQNCLYSCNCSESMLCDHINGECFCKEGWMGNQCSLSCENGYFGRNCSQKCNCKNGGTCNTINGVCTCTSGYYGPYCEHTCPSNRWGENCSEYCLQIKNSICDHITGQYTCFPGLTGLFCDTECAEGKFGNNCMQLCDCDKNTEKCDKRTGECICKLGYKGERCEESCENYLPMTWGYQCGNLCNCKNAVSCDVVNGKCICMDGFSGTNCDEQCNEGYYGKNCSLRCICEKKNTEVCETVGGYCKCHPGYTGVSCNETCKEGYWGKNCYESCHCYNNAKCDHEDGFCYCAPGYHGRYCEIPCSKGMYGEDCRQKCQCKNNGDCNKVDGHCSCPPGFAGKFCESKCIQGKFGKNCSSNCRCVASNTQECDSVDGFCYCKNGFIGIECEKDCDNGFLGNKCNDVCPICYYNNSTACDRRYSNCSCPNLFTSKDCLEYCDWSHFGYMCKQQCNCKINEICNNVNGQCYKSDLYLVTIKFRAPSQLFLEISLQREIQRNFEKLMYYCFERLEKLLLNSSTLNSSSINISLISTCSSVGGDQMFDSVNTENSSLYVMRIYSVFAMFIESEEITGLTFTLLKKTQPVNASFILDVISFIGINAFSAVLNFEYYVGEASFKKQEELWYTKTVYLASFILSAFTVLLFFFGIIILYRRKIQSSPFEKVRRESNDIELKSCLVNGKGHAYSFENPYYDVIAAMGLDDEIEEDYYNPLYMLDIPLDSDNELDDMYYVGHKNERSPFLYDKDSGISNAVL
ncbi:uncharacterized protein LOC101236159 isoform X2 [Hydra vulgaris]|uniref:Uncharacterized protein LOC101236159 isoform X2 n=1 Tax=Hydra vulgaris TaxID=6087 RepID=A0ABM4BLE3_HYDVU